jgi:hypothetical protein
MRQNAGLLSRHVSSISKPFFRRTIVSTVYQCPNLKAVWVVQHWAVSCVCCTEEVAAHTTNSPALHNPDGFQVWTPESGTHYCTPEDGHTNARNMLGQ